MRYVRKNRAFEFLSLPFLDILTVVIGGLGAALMVSVPGLFAGKRDAEQLQLIHHELLPVAYGDPYDFPIAVRGGVPPYHWAIDDSERGVSECRTSYGNQVTVGLPPGLDLVQTTGVLRGLVRAGDETRAAYCLPILVSGRDRVDPQTNEIVRSPTVGWRYLLSFYGTRETLNVLGPDSLIAPIGTRINQKYNIVGTHFDFSVTSVSDLKGLTVSKTGKEIELSGVLPLSLFQRVGRVVNIEFIVTGADKQTFTKTVYITIASPQINFEKLYIRANYDQPFKAVVGGSYTVPFTAVGGVGTLEWSSPLGGCCLSIDRSTGVATISAQDAGRESKSICVTDVRLDHAGLNTSVCVPFIVDFVHPDIDVVTPLAAQFIEELLDQHVLGYNIQGGAGDAFQAQYFVDGDLFADVGNIRRGENSAVLSKRGLKSGVHAVRMVFKDKMGASLEKNVVVHVYKKSEFPIAVTADLKNQDGAPIINIGFGCRVGGVYCELGQLDLSSYYDVRLLGPSQGNILVTDADPIVERPLGFDSRWPLPLEAWSLPSGTRSSPSGTWSWPPGMKFSKDSTGSKLSGTPEKSGVYEFGFDVFVSSNLHFKQLFRITVNTIEGMRAALKRAEQLQKK
jgi:hypothetical protein